MSTALAGGAYEQVLEQDERPQAPRARRRRRKPWGLHVWGVLVILWLLTPILVMTLFSFNDNTVTNGRSRVTPNLNGFTLTWYGKLFDNPALTESIRNSLIIAAVSTVICVVLGTLMGVALGRWKFRGSGSVNLLLFANIAAPEVVLGSALLTLFLAMRVPLGFLTLIFAHVMLCVAYVVVTVRARMAGMDPFLEEAARDLGAGPVTTFVKITLPSIAPGVFAGALLAFAMSIDDYIVTSFNNGATTTFPLWVWGAKERNAGSLPPQVYVMGSVIFAIGVLIAVAGVLKARRKA